MTQILTKKGQITIEARAKDILSLMENAHVSAEMAMQMLNVPESEKQLYLFEISRLQSK